LRTLRVAALVLTVASPAAAQINPAARVVLRSQPGDYIGLGQSVRLIYPDSGPIFPNVIRLVNGEPADLSFSVGNPGETYSTLTFGTYQLGIKMQVGDYPDAERASFASPGHPGLDVSFQHRGCNAIDGSFTVLDATFSGQIVESFAARFEQHCEGGSPALFGLFSYQRQGEFEPLVAGATVIRRIHVVELRARIAALQVALGLPHAAYLDAALPAGVTSLRAEHVSELRSTLSQVYQAAGREAPSYTDPDLSSGMTARRAHVHELREAIIAIEAVVFAG
jgi:hypothetical protein